MRSMTIPLLSASLLFCFLLFCSKDSPNNSTNTITISGTVTLEGQTDHSGVTVSLYRTVALDAELVAVNQQYPNIGVQTWGV